MEIFCPKKIIISRGSYCYIEIICIVRYCTSMENSLNEIKDVQIILNKLFPLVDQAEARFKSARNWGVVDILGGGLITDLIKHSHLGAAGSIMNEISDLLRDLQHELKDIDIPTDYRMQMGGFATFADFVFDGALADAWMESKIVSSLDQVRQLKQRLHMLQDRINDMSARFN